MGCLFSLPDAAAAGAQPSITVVVLQIRQIDARRARLRRVLSRLLVS